MRIGLFPYSVDNRYLCKYEKLCKYKYSYLISYGSFFKDVNNPKDNRIILLDDAKSYPVEIDRVFFVDCNILSFEDYDKALKLFVQKGIEVVLATGKYDDALMKNNSECSSLIKDIHDIKLVTEISVEEAESLEKRDISVPIIAILGTGYNVSKFDIQLYLGTNFIKKGYRVSQIASKKAGELFGFHSTPDFMFNNKYSNQEKIFKYNEYVRLISKTEKPDVIIIGVPEPILPLNKKHPFNMGIIAYEVMNAVDVDYTILALMHGVYSDEFKDEMNNFFKYRYNTEIDDFYISNFTIVSNSLYSRELTYAYVSDSTVSDIEGKYWHEKDLDDMMFFNRIEEQLKRFADYEQF
ncbi:MAG: TIGR04066 family peptide maturation system protein [Lachnospiraceae bacterium]|nr:TIGR04066 family peptide maturation system protein [Lachnospiraceae bacterium]